MDIKDLSLESFAYNPDDNKAVDELISSYDEFQLDLGSEYMNSNRRRAIKYIILMYDPNSELKQSYNDLYHRKSVAAQLAGFPIKKRTKSFDETVEDALIGTNEEFNTMCVRYMMLFNDPDRVHLMVLEELIRKQTEASMAMGVGAPPSDYKNLTQTLNNTNEQYKSKLRDVFGGDESREMKRKLYEYLTKEKLGMLLPENAASSNIRGEQVVNIDPYKIYEKRRSGKKSGEEE